MSTPHVADPARLLECVHCGLCLEACPTYLELGTEADSPRGRIHLVRALEEGTLLPTPDVVRHLDLCLGCRACETACPSGVRYGQIIEQARAYVEREHRRSLWDAARRRLITAVFTRPDRLRSLLAPIRFLQRSGFWPLARLLVPSAALVPELREAPPPAAVNPARAQQKSRVGLLLGCVARELFPQTTEATIRVLTRNGVRVDVPNTQGCCGALHLHSGDIEAARKLARQNIDAFSDEHEAIVVTAAGCGAAMREYGELLADDERYAERARRFGARVRDASELLASLSIEPPAGALARRVTYHDACHLAHGQRVREQPRQLLRLIPELELVELPESDVCCGSAGSYNLTEPQMAERLLERKIEHIAATGATCVVAANPGCILQIRAGLERRGLKVRVAHPVELLDEAYGAERG
jgi:glycolate oxidase iron-sulfur subunit